MYMGVTTVGQGGYFQKHGGYHAIDCLLRNYRVVCEAVEEVRNSSSGQSANDADTFLSRLHSFEFFVSAVMCRDSTLLCLLF